MNHNYSTNGSPFTQQQSGNSYPSQPSPVPGNGASGPGMPGQYGYPMPPHSPYTSAPPSYPTGYPPYAQQQMMMYGPPQTNPHPDLSRTPSAASPIPSAAPAGPGKRKRKSTAEAPQGRGVGDRDSDPEGGGSGSDRTRPQGNQSASAASLAEMKKRTKTQRACDSCRSRKIRYVDLTRSLKNFPVRNGLQLRTCTVLAFDY